MSHLGYFGKTPHRGDFVRFNLPQSFIKVWDDWLQQIMIEGESQATAWPDLYANAPAYRFVLSSGIAGSTPWIGVLRTSQDKVGRRFPFCLAMSLPERSLPCHSVMTNSVFLKEADALIDRVLTSDYVFDDLQDELALMAERHRRPETETDKSQSIQSKPFADSMTISMKTSDKLHLSDALPALLDTVLQQTLGDYSIWMANGRTNTAVVNSGLPVDTAGLALISANWDKASTAMIDLTAINSGLEPAEQTLVTVSDDNDDQESSEVISAITGAETNLHDGEFSASEQASIALSANDETIDTTAPVTELEPASIPTSAEQNPSADDWAALDEIASTVNPNDVVFVPEVEPLELEEDDVDTAPWEN